MGVDRWTEVHRQRDGMDRKGAENEYGGKTGGLTSKDPDVR